MDAGKHGCGKVAKTQGQRMRDCVTQPLQMLRLVHKEGRVLARARQNTLAKLQRQRCQLRAFFPALGITLVDQQQQQ